MTKISIEEMKIGNLISNIYTFYYRDCL